MLNLSLFSMFIVISLANIFAPGAGVVYAITTGIQGGLRGNFWCRVGLAVGILVLMTASVSGLGVIVANSPTIFTVLRFIGIAYLIYLGIKAWRAPATSLIADGAIPAHNGRRQFAEAFMLQIAGSKTCPLCSTVPRTCLPPSAIPLRTSGISWMMWRICRTFWMITSRFCRIL